MCPLAFFSKISQQLTWIQKRKVPNWFENNFYFFQYFLLFLAFGARLVLLNYDSVYLAFFLISVILSAFMTNLFFTGKSWCNFLCPVGIVEKIYCGSDAHQYNTNSACSTCSACKSDCPDIDMESNYWKESANEQKKVVFYSFTGLVLGFYLYFYLQSGSFSYYFSGDWVHNNITLLSSGFFFAPFIPIILAVPITLIVFSVISFYLFKGLEVFLWQYKVFNNVTYSTLLHRVKIIAAFIAFNIFYIFAGAPTYLDYPVAYAMFYFLIVAMSAVILHREFFREESFFIQERFALRMIQKWDSSKPIPTNLKEIYYTYANKNKNKRQQLITYRETIHDLMKEGILRDDSMGVLEKLRSQMGISHKDHLNVIRDIKLKNEYLFDEDIEKSSERRHQRNSYKKMIADALEEHRELNSIYIKSLQKQFCISDQVHKEITDQLLNSDEKFKSDVLSLIQQIKSLLDLQASIYTDKSREISFLIYTIENEYNIKLYDLFKLLNVIYKDNKKELDSSINILRNKNMILDPKFDKNSIDFMDNSISDSLYKLIIQSTSVNNNVIVDNNKEIIRGLLNHKSIPIATSALLKFKDYKEESLPESVLERFESLKEDNDISDLLDKIMNNFNKITNYDKMMYLHNIPVFKSIKFRELNLLAHSAKILSFKANEYIVKQGGMGDTLFIIISGNVNVEVGAVVVNQLGDKDYFGEIALLGDSPRTASVKSVSDVQTLTLSKDSFKTFIYENPSISVQLMKEIIHKLLNNTGQRGFSSSSIYSDK